MIWHIKIDEKVQKIYEIADNGISINNIIFPNEHVERYN